MPRFMHFSDTHLGNREYMLSEREDDFYESFRECIDIAINEKVDFIIHSGDLFDTWSPSNRSLAELKDSLIRVREKNIPVFMVLGDHDRPKRVDYPAARIFDFLGLHLMGTEDLETHVLEDGTLIAGISNMKGSRREKLPDIYSRADSYARDHHNSVFISHQGVSGYTHPEDVQIEERMLPSGYSYLAFGHIHISHYRKFPAPFAYAGSTEINSAAEIPAFQKDGKAVNIIDLDNGNIEFHRIRLKSPRPQFRISTTIENMESDIERAIERSSQFSKEKKPLIISEVYSSGDYATAFGIVSKFTDRAMFRRPVIIKESAPAVRIGEHFDRKKLFSDYFRGDEKMADLALDIFSNVGGEASTDEVSYIMKRILEGTGKDANKKD